MNRITRNDILKKKYSSLNNTPIGPQIWGKYGWFLFHTIMNHYPFKPTVNDEINIKKFVEYFSKILPCSTCRSHFKSNLEKYPLTSYILQHRERLVKWSYDIHNEVNTMLYKNPKSYDEFLVDLQKDDTKEKFELYGGKFIEYVISSYPDYLSIGERNNFLNFIIYLNKTYPAIYISGYLKKQISKPLPLFILGSKEKLLDWFYN